MSNKFKRYGIPVRVENTPEINGALSNPVIDSITIPGNSESVKIERILNCDDLHSDKIHADIISNPSLYDNAILTAGATSIMVWSPPCLIEGTQILMGDGTHKNIEQVKSGDIVKSYDPNTKSIVDSVVIKAYMTGRTTQFKVRQFSDGNRIIVYGLHKYFDPATNRPKQIPTTEGWKALNENLEEVECIGNRFYSTYGTKTSRYNIICSGNTYFADGILCSCGAQDKLHYFINRGGIEKIPENVREILNADCATINSAFAVSANKEYLAEVAEQIFTYRHEYDAVKKAKIAVIKEKDETKKSEINSEIEKGRAAYKTALENVKAIRKKYNVKSFASVFAECCERDNAAIETFKEWLIEGYTKPEKKGKKK